MSSRSPFPLKYIGLSPASVSYCQLPCFLKTHITHQAPPPSGPPWPASEGPSNFSEPPQPWATNAWHLGSLRAGSRSGPSRSRASALKQEAGDRGTQYGQGCLVQPPGTPGSPATQSNCPPAWPVGSERMGITCPPGEGSHSLPQCQVRRSGHREGRRGRAVLRSAGSGRGGPVAWMSAPNPNPGHCGEISRQHT